MNDTRHPGKSAVARWVKLGAAALLVPAALLLVAEGALRLAGSGYETDFFVPIPGQEAWTTNPRFARQFFPPALVRVPRPARIAFRKPGRTVRVLVLGGSAAMGEPDPAYSFGRMLEVMLEARYAGVDFEVVNGAMATINSHVVRVIAEEAGKLSPDIVLVYAGNNEVVGPFGAGTVFGGRGADMGMIRAGIHARRTRLGQLVERVVDAVSGTAPFVPEGQGMAMFLDQRVPAWDPGLEAVYGHYETNLRAVVDAVREAGAVPVLANVGSNTIDHAPFASMHRPGVSQERADRFDVFMGEGFLAARNGRAGEALNLGLMAVDLDGGYAEARYQVARQYLASGNRDSADAHAIAARDLDALRFRADSRINATVRRVAEDLRVVFVDVVAALDRASGDGLPGDDLFYEHVHLRPAGNYVTATAMAEAMRGILPDSVTDRETPGPWLPRDACERALALTLPDAYRMWASMAGLMRRAPFTNQAGFAEKRKTLHRSLLALRQAADGSAARDAASALYAEALRSRPDDLDLRQNHAQFLQANGLLPAAAAAWQALLDDVPDTPSWQIALATALSDQGAHGAALEVYRRLRDRMPGMVLPHIQMGYEYVRGGSYEEAVAILREALDLNPGSTVARLNLALLLADLDRKEEAVRTLSAGLSLAQLHGDRQAEAELLAGMAKVEAPDDPQAALRVYRRVNVLFAATRDVEAQIETLRQTAGVETGLGRYDEALIQFGNALDLARTWFLPEQEGLTLSALAACRMAMGDRSGAMEEMRAARAVFMQVSARHPAVVDLERGMAAMAPTAP